MGTYNIRMTKIVQGGAISNLFCTLPSRSLPKRASACPQR